MRTQVDNNSIHLPRVNLRGRQLYDLELLLVGGFAPLFGFMSEEEYESVISRMELPDGSLFPIPVVLDVPSDSTYTVGDQLLLCDSFGNPLAVMDITSRFVPDKEREALLVYKTTDLLHPGVSYLFNEMHGTYIGGPVRKINLPHRHDFREHRHTPEELKAIFRERGWNTVIGFQTRNPMHRAHFELVKRAHERVGAPVLIHPVVGMTKPGDVDYVTRVHTYKTVCSIHGADFTYLSLLPLAMRMAGPREALWHALIRKNYGCTHFIAGRDHAGPGKGSDGRDFYGPYEARDLALSLEDRLGVTIVPSEELAYSKSKGAYVALSEISSDDEVEQISGTEFRRRLREGIPIPEWFSFKENIAVLRRGMRRDAQPGIAFLFTGLSGAGKSTIAGLLRTRLLELQDRDVTFLDGDEIRQHLSKGLTFSKEDRDENVRRVAYVAGEVVRHGGIAICALIAPYRESRRFFRSRIEEQGVFVEIFVDTPLSVCEERDTKGIYKLARDGVITTLTGVNDPYELPEHPELIVKTVGHTPDELIEDILTYLRLKNLLPPEPLTK